MQTAPCVETFGVADAALTALQLITIAIATYLAQRRVHKDKMDSRRHQELIRAVEACTQTPIQKVSITRNRQDDGS